MAITPTQMLIPITGEVILRLAGGQEIKLGDVNYTADVDLVIGLKESDKFTFSDATRPEYLR